MSHLIIDETEETEKVDLSDTEEATEETEIIDDFINPKSKHFVIGEG
jgi:hypothetical protein